MAQEEDGTGPAGAPSSSSSSSPQPLPPYQYTEKHRWDVRLHFMTGGCGTSATCFSAAPLFHYD